MPLPRGQYKLCVQSNHYMTFISCSVTKTPERLQVAEPVLVRVAFIEAADHLAAIAPPTALADVFPRALRVTVTLPELETSPLTTVPELIANPTAPPARKLPVLLSSLMVRSPAFFTFPPLFQKPENAPPHQQFLTVPQVMLTSPSSRFQYW